MPLIHYAFIDGLRGWAILLVLLVHTSSGLVGAYAIDRFAPDQKTDIDLPSWLATVCENAGHGVQLFFVVSAASLTLSALRRDRLDLVDYAIRRFMRIAPMFYIGILFYLALLGFGPRLYAPHGIGWADLLATFSFTHTWFRNSLNSVVPGGWSVGNEVMFYIMFPAMIAVLRSSVISILSLCILLIAVAQLKYYNIYDDWDGYVYWVFPNHVPDFMFGMIAGFFVHRRSYGASSSALLGLLLFVFMVFVLPQMNTVWPSIIQPHFRFAVLAAFLCVVLASAPSAAFTNRFITSVGTVSYSLYIVHFAFLLPAHTIAAKLVPDRGVTFLVLVYVLVFAPSYVVALQTFKWIELPAIRWAALVTRRRSALISGEEQG